MHAKVDDVYRWLLTNATLRMRDYQQGTVEYAVVEMWATRLLDQVKLLHEGGLLPLLQLPEA